MTVTGLRVVGLDALRQHLDRRRVIDAVRDALILQAQGRVQSPMPGQLTFQAPPGDCHIKYGHAHGAPTFTVKVATGFYDNPNRGLPTNHGLVIVWDAHTGAPRRLFDDGGWLTAWRTAAAAAIAAAAASPNTPARVGIIGTGLQARLALDWLPETLSAPTFAVWGRTRAKAERIAQTCTSATRPVRAVPRIEDLLADCNVVITATPSQTALFEAADIRPGTHVVALGADGPGKQELPPEAFQRASLILTDDSDQCVDHSDFGLAIRAGAVQRGQDVMLGHVLAGRVAVDRKPDDITIADLTGIEAEDMAIADLFSALLDGASGA